MDIYSEMILDHYKHPHNAGVLKEFTHELIQENLSCGDKLKIYLRVVDGIIDDVSFEGSGCAISMASASMLTDKLRGMNVSDISELNEQYIYELLKVPVHAGRVKCAMLSLACIKNAKLNV